jgi:hypothetical protein
MPCNVIAPFIYEGNLEIIWTEPICSNFIIVRLFTVQMLAEHIPLRLLATLSLAASICLHRTHLGLLMIPLMDHHLCGFLATVKALHKVEHHVSCRCCVSKNCRELMINIWRCNTYHLSTWTMWSISALTAYVLWLLSIPSDHWNW